MRPVCHDLLSWLICTATKYTTGPVAATALTAQKDTAWSGLATNICGPKPKCPRGPAHLGEHAAAPCFPFQSVNDQIRGLQA